MASHQAERIISFLKHIILTCGQHEGRRYCIGIIPPVEEGEEDLYLMVRKEEKDGRPTLEPVYCDEDIREVITVFIELEGISANECRLSRNLSLKRGI